LRITLLFILTEASGHQTTGSVFIIS